MKKVDKIEYTDYNDHKRLRNTNTGKERVVVLSQSNIETLNYPVAKNVCSIISNKGLKQKAVAKKAGLPIQAFNEMLNGRRLIKIPNILMIADALEVDINALFADEPEAGAQEGR